MAANNQTRQVAYDNPTALTRVGVQLAANSAGSGSTSGKFYAWAQMVLYGVTFATVTAGTSTYTASGTATTPAAQFSLIYITNTNTTGTAVSLGTNTIGPFTIGGTGALGTNVGGLQGFGGGVAGGYTGPYAVNTLGGTNTTLAWGTNTFTATGYPGGSGIGIGGLPVNPGDVLYLVNGTDATAVVVPILQMSVQGVSGNITA